MKLTAVHESAFVPNDARTMSPAESLRPISLCHVPLSATCAARSERNIATWREYLPGECVRTMIRMGWDYTT